MINRLKTKDFHFVLNSFIKKKLYSISKVLNLSLSKTIIFIIEKSGIISKKMHLLSNFENNKMENVNWDTDFHIYMRVLIYDLLIIFDYL
jgi:hypothetical protein